MPFIILNHDKPLAFFAAGAALALGLGAAGAAAGLDAGFFAFGAIACVWRVRLQSSKSAEFHENATISAKQINLFFFLFVFVLFDFLCFFIILEYPFTTHFVMRFQKLLTFLKSSCKALKTY